MAKITNTSGGARVLRVVQKNGEANVVIPNGETVSKLTLADPDNPIIKLWQDEGHLIIEDDAPKPAPRPVAPAAK